MADDYRGEQNEQTLQSYDEDDYEGRPRRGRRIMTMMIAIAAVLGFGVVLLYAYNKGRQVGTDTVPPVIKAQEGPVKVRPDNPGGMKVPDRDKEVFSRLEADKTPEKIERLLPPPEKPVTRPRAEMAQISTEAGSAQDKTTDKTMDKPPMMSPEPMKSPPPPPPPLKIDKPSASVEIKRPEVKLPAAPREEAASTPPAGKPVMAEKSKPAAKSANAGAPKKLAARPATSKSAVSGRYLVQISALRSDTAVRKSWSALQKRHRDVLGPLSLTVERKVLGGGKGTFYRMQAGPLPSRSAASDLCGKLKQRKLGCLVVRR